MEKEQIREISLYDYAKAIGADYLELTKFVGDFKITQIIQKNDVNVEKEQ